jgi:G patch domain-containing protein 1
MDEEDIREAEESRTLNTSENFAGFGTEDDAIRKAASIDIFRPVGETMGAKLLRKMGWREGSGIGPRIRRVARLDEGDAHETNETHLFAPDDVEVISLSKKTDHKGLGYVGELPEAEASANKSSHIVRHPLQDAGDSDEDNIGTPFQHVHRPNPTKKRTGFGVGVLNDDGSDDEDLYSMGPRISYNKALGGDKKPKKPKVSASSANPLLKNKPTFISKKLAGLKSALRKCHDGRLPPDGFVLADELDSFGAMSLQDEKYRPPEVPEGWQSSKAPGAQADTPSEFVSAAAAAKASNLTAKSRAILLGESQLPGKSVFDYLTPAARDRVAAAAGRQNLPPAGGEAAPSGYGSLGSSTEGLDDPIPRLDPEVAHQALKRGDNGWMPYGDDENKRSRYRRYLEICAGTRPDTELPPRAKGMRQEDWILEMQEFARAAQVFKPISGLMASRFTSSSTPQGQDGEAANGSVDSLLSRPKAKLENPADAAAKMSMFGPMTRSFANFYPTRLLCKRFNVPMPTHMGSGEGASARASGLDVPEPDSIASQFRSFTSGGFQHDKTDARREGAGASLEDPETSQPGRKGSYQNEALEQRKPSRAVFEAIFGGN